MLAEGCQTRRVKTLKLPLQATSAGGLQAINEALQLWGKAGHGQLCQDQTTRISISDIDGLQLLDDELGKGFLQFGAHLGVL